VLLSCTLYVYAFISDVFNHDVNLHPASASVIILFSLSSPRPSPVARRPSTLLRNTPYHTNHRMTSSSSSLSTLQHVTTRKLRKLDDHRDNFQANKKAILAKVSAATDDRGKVEALLDGFEQYGITPKQADLSIANLKQFMHQAEHDSSISVTLLDHWKTTLEQELDVTGAKYEYAALFGKLVTEWIKYSIPATPAASFSSVSNDSESKNGSHVGRKELHEQREQWENHAFTPTKIDQGEIEMYLNDIFQTALESKKITESPLQKLRDSMKRVMNLKSDLDMPKKDMPFKKDSILCELGDKIFTMEVLLASIRGVEKSDLFTGEKRETLVELKSQPAVLKELVDVLNMDLEGLDKWEWDGPVSLNMRRQVNGKYRVYMDEEVHQAILLYFIGKTWAVALKKAFESFYHSDVWRQASYRSMGKKARQRREHFTSERSAGYSNIRHERSRKYRQEYFMMQLPSKVLEEHRDYTCEDPETAESLKSHLATKQSMLRLLTTELLLNTKLYGEFVVVQSDFQWFGPSLPHDTILAVMKFFGVPENWLRFFKKFLEVPVVFTQDGPDGKAHIRMCGIPNSHVLSDALSEAVLFCLDFAVTRRTNGANLYRFHDDLWFWGQESTSIEAWKAIQEFTTIMGLRLNEEKTGATFIIADKSRSRPLSPVLPTGKIHWGFLQLDASSGRWVVNRPLVDKHIAELKRQLDACNSTMAWVQAWNSYVGRFFITNLGEPANCFGRQHNDIIIATFSHIQRTLFAESGTSNVTEYVREVLQERLGVSGTIPDGFLYFPIELGGIGLTNPFINAFATYQRSLRDPGERIERAFEEEREAYEYAKERWDQGDVQRQKNVFGIDATADEPFMSFDEYTKFREDNSEPLSNAYKELLDCPLPEELESNSEMLKALRESGAAAQETSPYWLWIFNLYAGDLKQRFGGQGLQLGDRDMLPIGLAKLLQGEKVRWEG
jgi:hypothetical protein